MSTQLDDTKTTSIVAALGSVIGYVGAEVAGPVIFERLLWPDRFYNDLTIWIAFKLAIFMPMGGPLHKAALEVLDAFRKNGLYAGKLHGDMLGTAFFQNTTQRYTPCHGKNKDKEKDARNLIWIASLRYTPKRFIDDKEDRNGRKNKPFESNLKDAQVRTKKESLEASSESNLKDKHAGSNQHSSETPPDHQRPQRTTCFIYHLQLREYHKPEDPQGEAVITIQENRFSFKVLLGIICSEVSALALALIIGVRYRNYWLPPLLCVPLALKLLALLCRVRRTSIRTNQTQDITAEYESSDQESLVFFKIQDGNHSFFVIDAPPRVFAPFARHYGHPERNASLDLIRQWLSIGIVYAFVLIFPAGLLSLIWLPSTLQYFWLGYQAYLILVMHVSRFFGFQGAGRTEERISRQFQNNKTVVLQSRGGLSVSAKVVGCYKCIGVENARKMVNSLIAGESHLDPTHPHLT